MGVIKLLSGSAVLQSVTQSQVRQKTTWRGALASAARLAGFVTDDELTWRFFRDQRFKDHMTVAGVCPFKDFMSRLYVLFFLEAGLQ